MRSAHTCECTYSVHSHGIAPKGLKAALLVLQSSSFSCCAAVSAGNSTYVLCTYVADGVCCSRSNLLRRCNHQHRRCWFGRSRPEAR